MRVALEPPKLKRWFPNIFWGNLKHIYHKHTKKKQRFYSFFKLHMRQANNFSAPGRSCRVLKQDNGRGSKETTQQSQEIQPNDFRHEHSIILCFFCVHGVCVGLLLLHSRKRKLIINMLASN